MSLRFAEQTRYVVGFLFSTDGDRVVLVKKRPTAGWQANLLNGVGGHIEPTETPWYAMVREFREETGVSVWNWKQFATLSGPRSFVHVFRARHVDIDKCETTTDEEVAWYSTEGIGNLPVVPNLKFLVPLALHDGGLLHPVQFEFDD